MSPRAAGLLALVPALALAGPAPAGEPDDAFEQRVREALARRLPLAHYDPADVDADEVVARCAELLRQGMDEKDVLLRGVADAADQSFYGFAPRGAVHDDRARYALPFVLLVPRYLSQGPRGKATHQSPHDLHAYDFAMPIGTPVRAARAGRVARVVDGFADPSPSDLAGSDAHASRKSNQVVIAHPDGTYGVYLHLDRGSIQVEKGDAVERGQVIARSGMSGSPHGPHLHFVVRRLDADGAQQAVPIRFGPPGSPGFMPKDGQFLGAAPPTNASLRIQLDGQPGSADVPIPWKRGQRGQLRVLLEDAPGGRRDVTRHSRTRYDSLTPWSVKVVEGAVLVAEPERGFDWLDAPGQVALVQVLHLDPGKKITAKGVIALRIDAP